MNIPIVAEPEEIYLWAEKENCIFCDLNLVDYSNIPYGPLLEEWRDVVGFEQDYKISNYGKVIAKFKIVTSLYTYKSGLQKIKSIPRIERELKQYINEKGYWKVGTKEKGKLVHRLIAMAFLPNCYNKPQVNHKNSIRDDKFISNLEWCTPLENTKHAIENSILYKNRDLASSKRKINYEQFLEIKEKLARGIFQSVIAEEYPISRQTISLIKSRKSTYDKL